MFLLIESTEEEVCPIQEPCYPKDFASYPWIDPATEDATHKQN